LAREYRRQYQPEAAEAEALVNTLTFNLASFHQKAELSPITRIPAPPAPKTKPN